MSSSEKLREHQYREGYARSLEGKRVEWDEVSNVEQMCEQVKQIVIDNAREVCGFPVFFFLLLLKKNVLQMKLRQFGSFALIIILNYKNGVQPEYRHIANTSS